MKRIFSKEKSRKEKKADFYILYTIVFAAISLFIYSCFYFNGKSLIWSHDGVPQHINALAYYGKYLRNVLQTLVTEHKLSLPMWDMHIGYGSDILTTLHYYAIGDPLTLLSVFVPEKDTEILYEILIFLRIYLAGYHIQHLLLLPQESQTGHISWKPCLYFCRMDHLCVHEAPIFFQSHDLSAAGPYGN